MNNNKLCTDYDWLSGLGFITNVKLNVMTNSMLNNNKFGTGYEWLKGLGFIN